MARYQDDETDSFIDSDIGYPNRRAQHRGYVVMVFLLFLVGVLALVGGAMQNWHTIVSAFPTLASLQDSAAWSQFFDGAGRLIVIGLIVIFAALFLRWRIRRARRRR